MSRLMLLFVRLHVHSLHYSIYLAHHQSLQYRDGYNNYGGSLHHLLIHQHPIYYAFEATSPLQYGIV